MQSVERRLNRLEKSYPPRQADCDPADMSTEELSFELLECVLTLPEQAWADNFGRIADEMFRTRDRMPQHEVAGNDLRLTDPKEFYVTSLLRNLLGPFHDKVKNPPLLIERYRGRLPDRSLAATYYAACHGPYAKAYSPAVREQMWVLAGMVGVLGQAKDVE